MPSGSFYGLIQDLLARMSVDRHQGEEKGEDETGRQVGDLGQGEGADAAEAPGPSQPSRLVLRLPDGSFLPHFQAFPLGESLPRDVREDRCSPGSTFGRMLSALAVPFHLWHGGGVPAGVHKSAQAAAERIGVTDEER